MAMKICDVLCVKASAGGAEARAMKDMHNLRTDAESPKHVRAMGKMCCAICLLLPYLSYDSTKKSLVSRFCSV